MIVVTGGSGHLGRAIVESLLKRVEPSRLGVSARDPSKLGDLAQRGVRVHRADYGDAPSLRRAFEGAIHVVLISSNGASAGQDPIEHHKNAIAAARDAGVGRLLYTSHQNASVSSAFAPGVTHATTEKLLADSGLTYTALRNGFYAVTALRLIGDARTSGVITAPRDGKVSWTTRADLADAAAAIVTGARTFDGPTPALTGAEALDLDGVAAVLSKHVGREITRVVQSDDEFVAASVKRGMHEGMARFMLGMFVASRNGEFDVVDPTLEMLIGRRPKTVGELLVDDAGV